ncbi:MAG TPA: CRISPR-associated endonuclease Cas2 [Candidatus Stercoripulliclostridium merdipullorum]|uniref:CRISPR-associated endoribonuclease Cas2 n=1 Tax=Candidatus Stercoripulliclostridium merdipullorum TaxID=2840952 RepID=A0A9D1NC94_9FIRM|nr:CRISPR-associated endonuclease Cas2 [Candidatus Stercoripulliclostridium merdipullorum]
MNYRFMRLMVLFDLPMQTDKDRREYSRFRHFLLENGFIMMQKSVYTKLVVNNVSSRALKDRVRSHLPPEGLVELLEITENQFGRIEYLVGEGQKTVLDTMDRLVEL